MSTAILYAEVNIFAIIILLLIVLNRKPGAVSLDQKLFNWICISVIALMSSDTAMWFLNGYEAEWARILNIILTYVYWFLDVVPCYLMVLFCYNKSHGHLDVRMNLIYAIPVFIAAILLAVNSLTGIIFTITEDNKYERGGYFLAIGALPFIHMIISSIIVFIKAKRVPKYQKRKYHLLSVFLIIPLIGSVFQICFYGLSTIWTCVTISIVMCYFFVQSSEISFDSVTGLNGRGRYDAYVKQQKESLGQGSSLCLILFDIDRYKYISEKYGLKEGNEVLVRISDILRMVYSKDAFISRMEGDEFTVILKDADEKKVNESIGAVRKRLHEENVNFKREYDLDISAGYSCMSGSNMYEENELYTNAYEMMYRDKQEHRKNFIDIPKTHS